MKKTCEQINLIHAYHDGQLASAQAAQVETHLRDCQICASELESLRQISGLFEETSLPAMTPLMLAQVHQRVDQRMNAKAERGVLRLAQWLSAAAAAILVASSLQLAFVQNTANADSAPSLAWQMTTAMLTQDASARGDVVTDEHSLAAWIVDDLSSVSRAVKAGE